MARMARKYVRKTEQANWSQEARGAYKWKKDKENQQESQGGKEVHKRG